MKIKEPTFEIIKQNPGIEGVYEIIEKAGRLCYASEAKEGDAKNFVEKLVKKQHFSPLEHGTVYLEHHFGYYNLLKGDYLNNPYSKSIFNGGNSIFITTNYAVLRENNWLDDLQFQCEPTKYHEKRVSVKFSTQIAISREYNRYRKDSVSEQSTRYCNFTDGKFGGDVAINEPTWVKNSNYYDKKLCKTSTKEMLITLCQDLMEGDDGDWTDIDYWLFSSLVGIYCYNNLVRLGRKAEQARVVLPLDTNTELMHTAFVSDWKHFFDQRVSTIAKTGRPHSDASIIADPMYREFIKQGFLK